MKITKTRLKQIIKEELSAILEEDDKVSKKIAHLMDKIRPRSTSPNT